MDDELEPTENLYPQQQMHPVLGKRRLDSAERYFHWAGKTHRKLFERKKIFTFKFFSLGPMEYFRGKRFWPFTKKDERRNKHEAMPNTNVLSHSTRQGIWQSGLVGRRRHSRNNKN